MGLNSPRFTRSSVKLPLLGMGYRRELEKLVAAKYNAEIMATEGCQIMCIFSARLIGNSE